MNYKSLFTLLLFGLFMITGSAACSQQEPDRNADASRTGTTHVTMYKSPNCTCCSKWADYMERQGFEVKQKVRTNMASIKKERGIPRQLTSCHTAEIDDYVLEGHVPVEAIDKLLSERPEVTGISVPGMPSSAPGGSGGNAPYDAFVFDSDGNQSVYGTF